MERFTDIPNEKRAMKVARRLAAKTKRPVYVSVELTDKKPTTHRYSLMIAMRKGEIGKPTRTACLRPVRQQDWEDAKEYAKETR